MHGRVHTCVVRVGGRCANQQGLECFSSPELLEKEANVVNQVEIVGKGRSGTSGLGVPNSTLPGDRVDVLLTRETNLANMGAQEGDRPRFASSTVL